MRRGIERLVEKQGEDDLPTTEFERTPFDQCFFLDRDYYVQAILDEDDTVLAFSVTTRSPKFNPTFAWPTKPSFWQRMRYWLATRDRVRPVFEVELGRTHFSDLGEFGDIPGGIKVFQGPRVFWYSEQYSMGTPGSHQTFAFTASSASWPAPVGDLHTVWEEIGDEWPDYSDMDEFRHYEDLISIPRFREQTIATTYTVMVDPLIAENYPSTYGPHGDEVSTLP